MGVAVAAPAQAEEPIKIALVHGMSGSTIEAFSKQAQTGFELGIEYATGGTNTIKSQPVEIIHKDTQFKPDVARAVLAEAYGDDEVLLAVGATSSGVTKGLPPIVEEYEKILRVEPAVADSLTGPDSNRYVFTTSYNSSMTCRRKRWPCNPTKPSMARRSRKTTPLVSTESPHSRPRWTARARRSRPKNT